MARKHGFPIGSFFADVDLSATCALYRFVTVASTADYVKLATGASNPTPLGLLQNSPSQNEAANVVLFGSAIGTGRATSCNLTFGKFIVSGSDGVAEPVATAAGSPINGRWLGPSVTSGSAYGEIFLFGPLTACGPAAS